VNHHRLLSACLVVSLFVAAAQPSWALMVDAPVQVGTVSNSVLTEISGLVGSRSVANTLWVHNDSGNSASLYAISTAGNLVGTYTLSGLTNYDWEDIAIGSKPGGGNYLYLADIGDNLAMRPFTILSFVVPEISLYRFEEPVTAAGGTIGSGSYQKLTMSYSDGARDAEALMVDPISGEFFIISKEATSRLYRAPANAFESSSLTLTSLGDLTIPLDFVTAADISPDGKLIVVRNNTAAYLFERGSGQSVWDALQGPGIAITLGSEPQDGGEAIGWAADGSGFYTTTEGASLATPQAVYFYKVTVPEPEGVLLGIIGTLGMAIFFSRGNGRLFGAAKKL
jgi:hypothetical protein